MSRDPRPAPQEPPVLSAEDFERIRRYALTSEGPCTCGACFGCHVTKVVEQLRASLARAERAREELQAALFNDDMFPDYTICRVCRHGWAHGRAARHHEECPVFNVQPRATHDWHFVEQDDDGPAPAHFSCSRCCYNLDVHRSDVSVTLQTECVAALSAIPTEAQ